MNMRHGSREHREELGRQVKDMQIRSVTDVRTLRERQEEEKYQGSRRFQMRLTVEAFRRGMKVLETPTFPPVTANYC